MSSSNELTGCDMVWAVTQDALNFQLKYLFEAEQIDGKVNFGDVDKDGMHVEAVIEKPPRVELTVPRGNRSATMLVPLDSGTITYWSGFGPRAEKKTDPVSGWKIALDINLNLSKLEQDRIDKPDSRIPKHVKEILKEFSSDQFTIRHIFLDLQDANLVSYNKNRSTIGSAPEIQANFGRYFSEWLVTAAKSDNPYVFGYLPEAKFTDKSLFQPTGSDFSVHTFVDDQGRPDTPNLGMSTLNFLLMTDMHPVPHNAGNFGKNLVTGTGISGTGYVAAELLHDKWVIPSVLPLLKGALTKTGLLSGSTDAWKEGSSPVTWTFKSSGEWKHTWPNADSGMVDIDQKSTHNVSCTLVQSAAVESEGSIHPGFSGSGYFSAETRFDSYPLLIHNWAWQSNKLKFAFTIQIIAGTDGTLQLRTNVTQVGDAESDHDESALEKFADWFKGGLGNTLQTASDSQAALQSAEFDLLKANLTKALHALSSKIILPAPSVFLYKNTGLTAERHLSVDFSYQDEA